MALPRLYAIVDCGTLDARGIGVRAFAEELREGGVRLLQYRDKRANLGEVLRAAKEIAAVFAGTEAKLLLNDHAALAAELGWGVHVGQGDIAAARSIRVPLIDGRAVDEWGTRNRGGLVGVSTHTVEQVRAACEPMSPDARDMGHPVPGADYVAIGPVFGTRTKLDAEAVVGLEGVQGARAVTSKPLVAIGGITLETCRSVIDAGADSVAVISGLFVEGRTVQDVARDFLERMLVG